LPTRKTWGFAILAFFATTLCGASGADEAANHCSSLSTTKSIERKLTLAGVPNFGEVNSTLYRGAQPTPEGFENLARFGISIVVDVRGGTHKSERKLVTKLGMRYVSIGWHCFHPQDEKFARFLTLLRENPGKRVFVHCRTGDDRSGMMVAAYRMAEQGWTPQEAMKEMEAYGFSSSHHLICPGLASYEAKFPRRFQTSPAFRYLRRGEHLPRR
jgi:tyrosine-protein phosphatase SIW14